MKILIADDHRLMRDGLKALIEREDGLEVVGEAATGYEAIAGAHRLKPDITIMDISMPELNGIGATERLLVELPNVKIIALSMSSDRRYVTAMFRAGAMGYLLKNAASDELITAIRTIAANHKYISPAIAGIVVEGLVAREDQSMPIKQQSRSLSSREREVLQLLAEGKSSKEIAALLSVAITTVETHRRQIMDKLNLRTIAELTKYAIREGLTSTE